MSKEEIAAQRAAEWREALRKEKKNKDRIEIERVRMTELAPEYRITNNEEVNCGLTMEQAQKEASRCLDCPDPQCMQGCPVNIKIPEFITKVADGDFEGAYQVILANALKKIAADGKSNIISITENDGGDY